MLTGMEKIHHWNMPLFVFAHGGPGSLALLAAKPDDAGADSITFMGPAPPSKESTSAGGGGCPNRLETD